MDYDEAITEYCIVETDQLEKLLRNKCQTILCTSAVDKFKWTRHGTCFVAHMECVNDHQHSWTSQPPAVDAKDVADSMYRGNLDLTTATIAAGLAYADTQRIAEEMDLTIMCQSAYQDYQSCYVMPTVDEVFEQHMEKVHEVLTEEEDENGPLNYAADAQCDSPGFSANLCFESFLELSTGLIASMCVIHKSESVTKTAQAMEPLGFQRCMQNLLTLHGRQMKAVVTDNHGSINEIMRRDYPQIEHYLDKWHFGRSLKKCLLFTAKLKECEVLRPWIRRILTHLWYAVDASEGNSQRCREMVRGISYYVANEHRWDQDRSFELVSECAHNSLSAEKISSGDWLDKTSTPWKKLHEILNNKLLLKKIGRIAQNMTTSPLENYHSVRLLYATKRKAYRFSGYRMRSQLAVMHNNYATMGQEPIISSTGRVRKKIAYSKATNRWTEKVKNVRPDVAWKRGLLVDVRVERLRFLKQECFNKLSFPHLPSSTAPIPRPIDDRTFELFNLDADT
uniref:MULE transposase domain-containing protein n=1 Tax=Plectus sambesii TaxID=2011161 RepID=A0A914UZ19_9BILA